MSLARNLYDGAMVPLSLSAAPFFSLHPRGRIRLSERYGAWDLPADEYLWFHGASLGEMQGLLPIIKAVRERYPAKKFLITSTSPTGLDAVSSIIAERRLLPFDAERWIERAIGGSRFSGFVFGETELWPSLLTVLQRRKVRCCLVNARISDATERWYDRLRGLFADAVKGLSVVCAGDESSAQRLRSLGVSPESIQVTGNAKFDKVPLVTSPELAAEVRQLFISGVEPVVTLGSIHPEEADVWIPAISEFLGQDIRFILVPRHNEKFDLFADLLLKAGIPFERRSVLKAERRACSRQVLLLDSMGELESVYSFSAAAFIGGTIRDIGGHNPLEAAMYGVALCAGPSRWNIKDIMRELGARGAVETVSDTGAAIDFLQRVLGEPGAMARMGEKGREVWELSRGATAKILSLLGSVGVLPG